MKYQISEIFDLSQVQELLNRFYNATKLTTAFIDVEQKVLVAAGWQDVCTHFHRICPGTCARCQDSDAIIKTRLKKGEHYVIYECENGLIDAATPVILEGEHVVSIFAGQLFLKPPDLENFRKRAREYGFNEDTYLKAVKKVPIFTRTQLEAYLEYLAQVALFLAELGHRQIQLRENEARIRRLVEQVPLAILIIDENEKPIFANKQFHDTIGFDLNVQRLRDWFVNSIPDRKYYKIVLHNWDKNFNSLRKNKIQSITFQTLELVCSDHISRLFNSNISKMEGDKIIITLEDISERRRIERDRAQSQKIDSLAVLAGGIAHDFNNILVGILGNINLMQTSPNFPLEFKSDIADLEIATLRASELTKQLLTFSKGGIPVKKVQLIEPVLRSAISFSMRGSNCKHEERISSDLPPVDIDAGQIGQVIQNLIINAIQAMPNGGLVEIIAEKLKLFDKEISLLSIGEYVKITVIDHGTGIPRSIQKRIFEPYFTTKPNGNGLGLATCYSIIKYHHGRMSFTSEENVGSSFVFFLPISIKPQIESDKVQHQTQKFHAKALVLEDDLIVQKTINKIFIKLGVDVDIAQEGEEAVAKYRRSLETNKKYDLIILDLTIPGGMGGKDTIKKILDLDPNVKAIVSSGYNTDPILSNYRDYGFKAVLPKPYRIVDVQQVLSELLGSGY